MTPSELKERVTQIGNWYFSRSSMKFFGDTMSNYGVRSKPVKINGVDCWELYRKKSVRGGLSGSAYFNCETFERVHKLA